MLTRRAVLQRLGQGALGGAISLLAACSGPTGVLPTPLVTTGPATATLPATPTIEPTREPPRPRPAGTIGSGVRPAGAEGTPRVPAGFARSYLRVIHAAPALPPLVIMVDGAELGTVQYPEALAYAPILYGSRQIEGASALGAAFSVGLQAGDAAIYTIVVLPEGAGVRALMLIDDQPLPPANSCALRFLPLETTVGPLDLVAVGGAALTTGVPPVTLGPSVVVSAGNYTLEVRAPGRDMPLLTKPTLSLDAGDRYTAVLSGRLAAQSLLLLVYPDLAQEAL